MAPALCLLSLGAYVTLLTKAGPWLVGGGVGDAGTDAKRGSEGGDEWNFNELSLMTDRSGTAMLLRGEATNAVREKSVGIRKGLMEYFICNQAVCIMR